MSAPKKILVVDDEVDLEPLVLQRMRRKIRAGTYTFVFAHNGVEALDVLREDSEIDMVLSDINMPVMDGLTLLDQIRQLDPNLRAVIISAYGDMDNIRTAMNRGAFDFVTKPLDFEDLQLTIDRTLEHMAEWREALASRDKLVSLQNELSVASSIQQSILPTRFPRGQGYEVFGNMEPARSVGGDFYDVYLLESDRIGIAIADVSDKGVPASLFMMSTRTLLKGSSIGNSRPESVITEVNNLVAEDNDAAMFVTVLYGVYNPSTGSFTYCSGGHNAPLIVHKDGTSELLPMNSGIALGVMPGMDYESTTVSLDPGDTVLLYTDGVTEAMDADDNEFGDDRLLDIFTNAPPAGCKEATEAVFNAVAAFAGDTPQSDDITCLALSHGIEGE